MALFSFRKKGAKQLELPFKEKIPTRSLREVDSRKMAEEYGAMKRVQQIKELKRAMERQRAMAAQAKFEATQAKKELTRAYANFIQNRTMLEGIDTKLQLIERELRDTNGKGIKERIKLKKEERAASKTKRTLRKKVNQADADIRRLEKRERSEKAEYAEARAKHSQLAIQLGQLK